MIQQNSEELPGRPDPVMGLSPSDQAQFYRAACASAENIAELCLCSAEMSTIPVTNFTRDIAVWLVILFW